MHQDSSVRDQSPLSSSSACFDVLIKSVAADRFEGDSSVSLSEEAGTGDSEGVLGPGEGALSLPLGFMVLSECVLLSEVRRSRLCAPVIGVDGRAL